MKTSYTFKCPGKNCGVINIVELDPGEKRVIGCIGCFHDVWFQTIKRKADGSLVERFAAGVGPGEDTRKLLQDAKDAGTSDQFVWDNEKETRGEQFEVWGDSCVS